MTDRASKTSAASIRARLENVARARSAEFQLIASDWAIERFLYRLGISAHAGDFVLKGAMLFRLWTGDKGRATWDLDLMRHRRGGVAELENVVREICSIEAADGIAFDADSIRGEIIRAAQEEAGVRLRFTAHLAKMRIPLQVDVGFGDVVTPTEVSMRYPTLLSQDAPNVQTYPRETVVAEKVEAIVSLGVTNSRMKDFYDVRTLAWMFPFDGRILTQALSATFGQRGTPLPTTTPVVLTREFLEDPGRATQWRAFLQRGRLQGPESGGQLSDDLRQFLEPLLAATARRSGFDALWSPGGPWSVPAATT